VAQPPGIPFPFYALPGVALLGVPGYLGSTAQALDSTYNPTVSGDAVCIGFFTPESQTSGSLTLYAWLKNRVGNPTNVVAWLCPPQTSYPARPLGTPNAMSGSVNCTDVPTSGGAWKTFSFASVSLTAGQRYYLVIHNATTTPASNYVSAAYSGGASVGTAAYLDRLWQGGYTSNGFSSDPSGTPGGLVPGVIRLASNRLFGSPFVDWDSVVSSTSDRGNRIRLPVPVYVAGVAAYVSVSSTLSGARVYRGTTLIATATVSNYDKITAPILMFDAPVRLEANVDYDVVYTVSSASTFGARLYMGTDTPPADVAACVPTVTGAKWSFISGSPGSYTVDATRLACMGLIVAGLPVGGLPTLIRLGGQR
jgi:hypothetical protein